MKAAVKVPMLRLRHPIHGNVAPQLIQVPGIQVLGGMAIVRLTESSKRYALTITKGPSAGYKIQPDGMSLEQARAMLKRLAPLANWAKLKQDGGNLSPKARQTLKDAVFIVFEELGLRPKGKLVVSYIHNAYDRQGNLKPLKMKNALIQSAAAEKMVQAEKLPKGAAR